MSVGVARESKVKSRWAEKMSNREREEASRVSNSVVGGGEEGLRFAQRGAQFGRRACLPCILRVSIHPRSREMLNGEG